MYTSHHSRKLRLPVFQSHLQYSYNFIFTAESLPKIIFIIKMIFLIFNISAFYPYIIRTHYEVSITVIRFKQFINPMKFSWEVRKLTTWMRFAKILPKESPILKRRKQQTGMKNSASSGKLSMIRKNNLIDIKSRKKAKSIAHQYYRLTSASFFRWLKACLIRLDPLFSFSPTSLISLLSPLFL